MNVWLNNNDKNIIILILDILYVVWCCRTVCLQSWTVSRVIFLTSWLTKRCLFFHLNILQLRLFNETHCLPIILSYFLKSMSSRGKSLWSDLPSIASGMFIVCILRRSAALKTKVTQLFLCSQAVGWGLGISKTLIRLLCLAFQLNLMVYLQLFKRPKQNI